MSAFLGKIHYWLYNKIQVEETILEEILNQAKSKGFDTVSFEKEITAKYGTATKGSLEDEINHDNIHGWLQDRITSVESRLASTVTTLLNNNTLTFEEIETIFENNAKSIATSVEAGNMEPSSMFNLVYDYLLAGMPCDRVNAVEEASDVSVKWSTSIDIHIKYWELVGGNVENFHKFIETWIKTFVSSVDPNFTYEKVNGLNVITKKQ